MADWWWEMFWFCSITFYSFFIAVMMEDILEFMLAIHFTIITTVATLLVHFIHPLPALSSICLLKNEQMEMQMKSKRENRNRSSTG